MHYILKIQTRLILSIVITLIISPLSLRAGPTALDTTQSIKIGVLAKRSVDRCIEKWEPTAAYLTQEIPGYSFAIIPLGFDEIYSAIEQKEIDFILTNSSFYVYLELQYDVSRMATLKNLFMGKALTEFGGVIFYRADRNDIKTVKDLKGKSFMAVEKMSFGGWQMAWRELKEQGIDPYRDFADMSFGGTHDAVVLAVRDGIVDAGTVRSDVLERMALENKINLKDYYTIPCNKSIAGSCDFPLLHTTRLYPEWPFAKVSHTSSELAEKVATALLRMSSDSPAAKAARSAGWTIPRNYQSVHDCLKYLHIGPYRDYGKVSFRDALWQYLPWIVYLLTAIFLIGFFALYVSRLNRKLQQAIIAQKEELVNRSLTEEALRIEKNKAQLYLDIAGVIIIAINNNGEVTLINQKGCEVLGYSEEDIIGKNWFDNFIPKWLRDKLIPVSQKLLAEEIESIEYYENPILTKSGQEKLIAWHNTLLKDNKGNIIGHLSSGEDITERKKTEEALRESEGRFRAVFETAQDSIFIKDHSLRYILANPAMEELLGMPASQLIGKTDNDLFGEEAGAHIKEMDSRVLYGEVIREEHTKPVNGIPFTFNVIKVPMLNNNGEIVGLCGIARDVTKQKQAEKSLKESEEKFRRIAEHIFDVILANKLDGTITYVSPSVERVFGYLPKELIGNNIMDLVVKSDIQQTTQNLQDIEAGKIIENHLSKCVKKDGSIAIIEINSLPTYKDKTIVGSQAIIRDITETKRLQELASQAQRLEAAGKIAGQVAHDFNNLLGPMIAYPDLIKNHLSNNDPAIPLLNDIEKAAEIMADINQELLTLSRRGHFAMETLCLNDVISQALKQIESKPDTLYIETRLSQDLMNIKGGAAQILRVFSNLINNARDAMQDNGHLSITTENFYVDKSIGKYGGVAKGEYAKVSIADTGCGIPEDILSKLYEPFFTTKTANKKRGSGLGLSVVHAVMNDHNGYIDIQTKVGQGTTFYLYFPITRESIEMPIPDDVIGGSESVLVVDDDDFQREVALNLLKKLGYNASAVNSGEVALEFLKNNPQDLLVLDMIMPGGIDGAETYQKRLEINPSQKAVIISGFAETERVNEAIRLGAGTFIKKPLTIKTIAKAVRREIDKVRAVKA
ncbi:MAG: PAS domain S-box protein [candidate division Zixibacteria bacterium]|nr:PAS domain S-box protein [candidate division Zixibacteria bacterium]